MICTSEHCITCSCVVGRSSWYVFIFFETCRSSEGIEPVAYHSNAQDDKLRTFEKMVGVLMIVVFVRTLYLSNKQM